MSSVGIGSVLLVRSLARGDPPTEGPAPRDQPHSRGRVPPTRRARRSGAPQPWRELGLAFSAVCCAKKPTAASGTCSLSTNSRKAARSPAALACRRRPSPARSFSATEDTSLCEGRVHERTFYASPFLDVPAARDDHVGRSVDVEQRASQAGALSSWSLHLGLDHEEVEVAARTRVGPERPNRTGSPSRSAARSPPGSSPRVR